MEVHHYIDSIKAVKPKEGVKLDITDETGTVYRDVVAHRLFPLSDTLRYIALVDDKVNEVGIIRNAENLSEADAAILESALAEYYLIPQIIKIYSITEKYGRILFQVETDHGPREFEIRNRQSDIKTLFDNRVLITDSSDNRYEIPDFTKLDKKSFRRLMPQL